MLHLCGLVLLPILALVCSVFPFRRTILAGKGHLITLGVFAIVFMGRLLFQTETIVQKDANLLQIPFLQNYRTSILTYGQPPLWDPHLWLGMPSLAHPLFHAFSPVTFLCLLLPVHAAFNGILCLMIFFSCSTMFLLARELGQESGMALVCAVVYGFNEFTLDRLGAATGPGVEYLYSYAFVPLSGALLVSAVRQRSCTRAILFGASLAFVLNGNPNLLYYTLLLCFICLICLAVVPRYSRHAGFLLMALGLGVLALPLVDAMELLPFHELQGYVGASRLLDEAGGWRMEGASWRQVASLFLPHLPRARFGYAGRIGWIGLSLAVLSASRWRSNDRRLLILMLIVVGVGALFVTHSPLFTLMHEYLPYFARMSMIPAVFIMFLLPLSILAGYGSRFVSAGRSGIPFAIALLVFAEMLAASNGWIRTAQFTVLRSYDYARELEDFPHLAALGRSAAPAERIECRTEHYRMICPDYAVSFYGLRMVNGDRYQFPSSDVMGLMHATADSRALMDVRYVLSPEPVEDPSMALRQTVRWEGHGSHQEEALRGDAVEYEKTRGSPWDGTVYVYETLRHYHGLLEDESLPIAFEVTRFSPLRIALRGTAPKTGELLLSEPYYPGWKALVDGGPTPVVRLRGLAGIRLAEGPHSILYYYDPLAFSIGFWTSLLAVFGLIVLTAREARRSNETS